MQKIDKTDVLKKILSGRRFTVDYFQREYRWGRKQIEQMISDFQGTFEEYYDPLHDISEVANYGFYYMGCIICTGGAVNKVIDGQQRLTSLAFILRINRSHSISEILIFPGTIFNSKIFVKTLAAD